VEARGEGSSLGAAVMVAGGGVCAAAMQARA
jgi:hypothetical protein